MTKHPLDATLEAATFDPDKRKEQHKAVKLGGAGWKYAFSRSIKTFLNAGGTDLAAKLTYFMVLSLAPALLAIFSIITLVMASNRDVVNDLVQDIVDKNVSPDYAPLVTDLVDNMMNQSTGGVIALIIGIATALWSASAYVKAFNRAANQLYGYEEGRGFVKLTAANLLATLVVLVGIVVVLICLAVNRTLVEGLVRPIAEPLGADDLMGFLTDSFLPIWTWVKWPVIVVLVLLMIAVLYYLTPNVQKPKFTVFGPGNIVAFVGMILAAVALSVYFATLAGYSSYGAIGGVMALLFALWVFNIVLLLGLSVDAEWERAKQLRAGVAAESHLSLPPKDTSALVKKADAQEKLEEAGYALRADS
ncbi:YihY/virulence factor BrkB family protein [Micrococcus sp. FDAARGOS_333]|uniref:YihY/virulence factor BrkB family protein n=1 Tax=Micrococcus sp. FDAARGOS_333 TaxID=1930558 RepID=UPI000B4E4520|nr:YihY/virulence factor BrkB family protein [Micrococcus sp. FDAARGOS_333]PNL17246.1 YihY/virulence factor BrkB family protein [Micrococcus sp. FDAARGOS_333]